MKSDATTTEAPPLPAKEAPAPPPAKAEPERKALPAPENRAERALPPAPDRESPSPAARRRRWPWIVGIVVAALALYLVLSGSKKNQAKQAQAAQARKANQAIPVTGAKSRVGSLPVYLTGLGTVAAVNTVTVRSRVDGQLVRIDFKEGQLVKEGDLLAEIDPRPFQVQLTQAEGQLAKDQAALKNAQLDLQRYQVLAQQDSIPRQQLDTQAATVVQAEAALKTDDGQVASARLNLTYSRITAPISGSVGLKLVDPGNIVHASDANGILVITQLQPIAVVFTIPADRLPPVLAQMKRGLTLPVEAWDRDLRNRLDVGTLLAVDNQIDQTTGTVRIKAVFPNQNGALFSNQFVNARLLVDTLNNVVLIPAAALQRSPQSVYVYVVKPDSTVEMRNVDVALTEGDQTAIRKGVAGDETVVIDGVDKLLPGSKVAVNPVGGRGAPGAQAGPAPAAQGNPARAGGRTNPAAGAPAR